MSQPAPDVVFRILGPLEAMVGGRKVIVGGQQATLLGVLLVQAPRLVPVSYLIEAIWDIDPPESARRIVQNSVSALRRAFADAGAPGPLIVADGPGYRMIPDQLDAKVFADLVEQATHWAEQGETAKAAEQLATALELWRGPALFGLTGHIVETAAAGLDEQRLAAAELRFELELSLGRPDRIVAELAGLVAAHPLRERLAGHLMLALHRSGRPAEAVQAYHRLRRELSEELGIDPGRAVQQIYNAILADAGPAGPAGSGPPARPSGPAEATPRNEPEPTAPAQLPADVASFTGRTPQLRALDEMVTAGGRVAAIAGMPGIGKTTLAVHWAHRAREQFPDGQLFVNLSGHGPGEPLTPYVLLTQLLDGLGVPAGRVPPDVQSAAGLYRTTLTGRRVLIVLDNAVNTEQVLPLLPGAPGCFVLVTSRDQLGGLITAVGARLVTLDVVSEAEARDILGHQVGAERMANEPAAVDRIVERCARLPLALAIVGARAATRPNFALDAIAAELTDAGDRLDALDGGAPAADVRAVLSWSYQRLSPAAARLFRLLSLHAGPDIGVAAAASLAGEAIRPTQRGLTELAQANLIGEPAPGRFLAHDLLRAYGEELATRLDQPAQRQAAVHRLLEYYLHSALAMSRTAEPGRVPVAVDPPDPAVHPASFESLPAALGWFAAERPSLVASVELAARHGFDDHAWRLAWAIGPILDRGGFWAESIAAQRIGVGAARRTGERWGEAGLHQILATAHKGAREFDDAHAHADAAIGLYREVGDQAGEGSAQLVAAGVFEAEGRFADALPQTEAARATFAAIGDLRREGFALSGLAHLYAQLGDHERAFECCERVLEPQRAVGDQARASVLDSRGQALLNLGQYDQALASFEESFDLFHKLRYPVYEVVTRDHIGDAHLGRGDTDAARTAWQEALDLLAGLDAGQQSGPADEIRAKLANL